MSTITKTQTDGEIAEDMIREHTGVDNPNDYAFVYPEGVAATRKALRNPRGLPGGQVRRVLISWASVAPASDADDFEIHGPSDGRVLVVENFRSPMGMKVMSGHVVFHMQAEGGNAVQVMPGARATIISDAGLKTTIDATAGSTVSLHAFDGVHVGSNRVPSHTRATVWGPREGSADVVVTGVAEQRR